MIKSVEFPEEGNGYIYEKVKKPIKPFKPIKPLESNLTFYKDDMEKYEKKELPRYEKELAKYKEDLKFYNKHKGEFVLDCSKHLVGRKFNFEPNKINVLFGRNGCGKTTIIKAIAGEAQCEDGFTSLAKPIAISFNFDDCLNEADVEKYVNKLKKNTSNIVWDGNPIYYYNFENKIINSHGSAGNLTGSLLTGVGEEILYILTRKVSSSGQINCYLLEKLFSICSKHFSLKSLIEQTDIKNVANDTWLNNYKSQIKRFENLPNYNKECPITLLLDEIDKSLDIETVWLLYHNILPQLAEKFGIQIICVTHSPLILTDTIYNSDKYNIISIDDEYTNNVKTLLKGNNF